MRLPLAITFRDDLDRDPVEVVAGPADFIAFERRYDTTASTLDIHTKIATDSDGVVLEEDGEPLYVLDMEDWNRRVKVEWVFFLAWNAARRDGNDVPDDFDAFIDLIEDVVLGGIASGVDPTGPTPDPSPAESPALPSTPASTPTASPQTPASSPPVSSSSPTASNAGVSETTSSP